MSFFSASSAPSFGFGSNPSTASSSVPSFCSASSAPSFGFGSNSSSASSAPSFGFGSNPSSASSAPSFGFGSKPSSASSAPSFGFGSNPSSASSAPSFGFGSNPSSASSAPSFGFGSNPSSASSAPSFGFGSNPSSSSLVGASTLFGSSSSATATAPSPNIYGSVPTPAVNTFGTTSGGIPTSSLSGFSSSSSDTAQTTSSFDTIDSALFPTTSTTAASSAPQTQSSMQCCGVNDSSSTTAVTTTSASFQSSSTTLVAASTTETTKMSEAGEFHFTLEVMIDKERSKVLFAESDSHFADILLSFLTLPLGRIVRVLEKHYGDEAPVIGSLTTLYHSLANLDTIHFCTEAAKLTLLNPKSSFELEYEKLKLDIYESQPSQYFHCTYHQSGRFQSVSVYYDHYHASQHCNCQMKREVAKKGSGAESSDGVFTIPTESFIISDDLQVLPNDTGLLGIINILGLTDIEKAEPITVTIGFNEIMSLLKASLTSQTPLSDLILNEARQMNSVVVETDKVTLPDQIANEEDPNSKKMSLKVMIQKSVGKVLYAQAKEDFVEFLFSFMNIPLGGVEHLVAGKTCNKALNNLYRSTIEFIHDEKFMTPDTKNRLIKPNLPHGCVSKDHILPLTEESLPADYNDLKLFSSVKFPKGQGRYLDCPRTYKVMDDLTVTPFCIVSTLSSLNNQQVPISDIKEVEMQIGLKEGLRILRASLTSTSALTDGLLNRIHKPLAQPKQESN